MLVHVFEFTLRPMKNFWLDKIIGTFEMIIRTVCKPFYNTVFYSFFLMLLKNSYEALSFEA